MNKNNNSSDLRHTPDLTLQQIGIFNGFEFALLRNGVPVGHVEFPWISQAKNARLVIRGSDQKSCDIQLRLDGTRYRIQHEYTKRAFFNDIRHILIDDDSAEELVSLQITQKKRSMWPNFRLTGAGMESCSLKVSGNPLWREFSVVSDLDQKVLGTARDALGLKLRREVLVRTPGISVQAQAMLAGFLSFYRF